MIYLTFHPKKKAKAYLLFFILLIIKSTTSLAQLPIQLRSGLIYINDGTLGRPQVSKYSILTDSLDKNLKLHPNDTTSLFLRAILYIRLNSITVNPDLGNKIALKNLVTGKSMAEKAITLQMQNFMLKVLRAEFYKELTNRFMGDESWKYNNQQIIERKRQFKNYKELANKYYDELALLDKSNAYDYQKLKVATNYPL
ncbi:MAG: hypothetical protein JWR09_744 [Mucilaginibacter sp.]|nr:hypothetical protein [Mucilaginibacter sp.]